MTAAIRTHAPTLSLKIANRRKRSFPRCDSAPVVRYELLVALDVGVKFLNAFQQFLRVLVLALEGRCVQIHFQALQLIQGLKHIAVPQVPLDPLQILDHARAQLVLIFPFTDALRQSLGSLVQYCQSHRQMKPVQQVFSLRIQIELHVAHVLAAVGEEIDLLFGLNALALEQLKQTALGFFIVGLNPGKAPSRELLFSFLVALKSQDALAGNHLEMSLLVPPADIATIDPDGKRTIGSRKFVPAPLAALDDTELFVAHFLLQPLRYIRDVLANGERIDGLVY